MHQYKNLDMWQRSCQFTLSLYNITKNFPKEERFGITNQMRRASVSIPSNIAEGASRKSSKEFARYIEIAIGSAFELETQLLLSHQLDFIDENQFNDLTNNLEIIIKQMRKFKQTLQPTSN